MGVTIKNFFDPDTFTFTYIVTDNETKISAIIDSVMGFNQYSGRTNTKLVDEVISYVKDNNLNLEWILETHIHADHLTGSHYIKEKIGGKIAVGSRILEVLKLWVPIFNTNNDTKLDASQFDRLLDDGDEIILGESKFKIIQTPGHTPACISYLIDDNIFVGDTIFMTDIGTARADFPGGSAEDLYDSIQKILSLPEDTKIYLCHDYPPESRKEQFLSNVLDQKQNNIMINENISKEEYLEKRKARDKSLSVPKLLLPSIQYNLRAGSFGDFESNNKQYIKIPIDTI